MVAKLKRWLSWRRLYAKLVKQEGTPESIARGVVLGLAVGFLIPIGGQVLAALALAFLCKANKIVSVMFTMLSNPYTAPFQYPAQCWLGSWLMGSPLKLSVVEEQFKAFFAAPSWASLMDLGGEFVMPFFVGGLALSVVSGAPSYWASLAMVRRYRSRKERKKLLRAKPPSGSIPRS